MIIQKTIFDMTTCVFDIQVCKLVQMLPYNGFSGMSRPLMYITEKNKVIR